MSVKRSDFGSDISVNQSNMYTSAWIEASIFGRTLSIYNGNVDSHCHFLNEEDDYFNY